MINEKWVLLSALLVFYGNSTYAISTLIGKTKPNRVTWILWTFIPIIVIAGQIDQQVKWQVILTLSAGISSFFLLLASLKSNKSYWKIRRLDYLCGLLSILAILLWLITDNPNLAILLSIMANFLAATPTILKSIRYPRTENYRAYSFASLSAIITLLTVNQWTFPTYSFSLYVLFTNGILFLLIRFELGTKVINTTKRLIQFD